MNGDKPETAMEASNLIEAVTTDQPGKVNPVVTPTAENQSEAAPVAPIVIVNPVLPGEMRDAVPNQNEADEKDPLEHDEPAVPAETRSEDNSSPTSGFNSYCNSTEVSVEVEQSAGEDNGLSHAEDAISDQDRTIYENGKYSTKSILLGLSDISLLSVGANGQDGETNAENVMQAERAEDEIFLSDDQVVKSEV